MNFEFDELPVTIDCHPSTNSTLLAVGHIDGTVRLCNYVISTRNSKSNRLDSLWVKRHKKAVRRVRFAEDGSHVYTATENRALCQWDTETGKKIRCLRKAHDCPVYSLCVTPNSSRGQEIASGDEEGIVKTWDFRNRTPQICDFKDQEEDITDLTVNHHNGCTLLSTSADATLAAYNLRSRKLQVRSEPMHSELLSVSVADGGRTFCGAGDGYLEVFNAGEWGNIIDRISTGHTESVDCLRTVQQNILISASTLDGTIRLTQINPNRSFSPCAEVEEGIEELSISPNSEWLIACGHDSKLHFWDLQTIIDQVPMDRTKKAKKRKIRASEDNKSDFFADLVN